MDRFTSVDFLSPKLSKHCQITSDGVSDDHYTLENLTSTDETRRNLGFMAFQVSKPPIEITIKFRWKINLKMLKVFSELLSLKSSKFQVFIQCRDREGNEVFRRIGYFELSDDQIGFCLKSPDCRLPSEPSLKTDVIYPYAKRSAQSINTLKILIQDTKLRRAPVIKKIEVWGFPSRDNPSEELAIYRQLLDSGEPKKTETQTLREPSIESDDQGFQIPEDFLDAITQDLLVMPYILPSGNIIDETTIDKHNRHEAVYGRLPSDPFTGLVYTSENHPKFNDVLKVRLDEFKLRNSQELEIKRTGRTLGRNPEPTASTSSSYTSEHVSKKIKLSGDSSDLDSLISSIYKNKQVSVFTKPRESTTTRLPSCLECKEETSSNLYRISICSHIFCKACLLKAQSACAVCNTTFDTKDVSKVNL